MSGIERTSPLDRAEFRRVWQLVTIAGLLGTAYFSLCIWGVPRVQFLREMGATAFHFGLISAFATAALGFQVISGLWANRLRRRKTTWSVLSVTHRLLFVLVLLVALPFFPKELRMWWIIGAFLLHDALMHLGAPMWFSWMADILPASGQNRHWGNRQRITSLANVALFLTIALAYNWFERHNQAILGFVILGSVGVVLGVADILCFIKVPEPEPDRDPSESLWHVITGPLRDPAFRPFIIFSAAFHFSILMANSFYSLYMIEHLKMSTFSTQLAITFFFLGIVIGSRLFGILCDTYGKRPVVVITVAARIVLTLILTFTPPLPYVSLALASVGFLIDGIAGSGLGLAFQGLLLQATPRRNRTMYIAATNFFTVGLAGCVGPFLSGWFIERMTDRLVWQMGPYIFGPYHIVFLTSAVLVCGAAALATRINDPSAVPVRRMLSHVFHTNPFRVATALHTLHDSDDERARVHAARVLGVMKTPLAISGLIGALDDGSRSVRRASANALGKIGMGEAIAPLIRALCNPNSLIQSPASRALARLGNFDSRQALIGNLRNLPPGQLLATIESLERLGDASAIAPLICLMGDVRDVEVRRRISQTLVHLGEKRLTDQLLSLMVRRNTRRSRRF